MIALETLENATFTLEQLLIQLVDDHNSGSMERILATKAEIKAHCKKNNIDFEAVKKLFQ